MTCDQAKEQLVLLAYEELDEASQGELELHLHICPPCEAELASLNVFGAEMARETVPLISPNLLTSSRMRLDIALDEVGRGSWTTHLRSSLMNTLRHLYAAPALATLLVGAGFLGGNLQVRYQLHGAQPTDQPPINIANDTQGVIGTVSGVYATANPNVVQVKYNRIVPMTFQGSIDEPEVRRLLMMGAQKGMDNDVRATSVGYLVNECVAGHRCEHATGGEGVGLRDALLVSLRYDKSASVRLKALEGLQRFVGEDQQVRDAVLESLSSDPSAEVRTHAIGMLTPVQGDSSVRRVLHTVSTQDENPYIRNASMQALGTVDGIQ